VRAAPVPGESTSGQVTNVVGGVEVLVGVITRHAFFGRTDIDLVVLVPERLLDDVGNDPGTVTDASGLQAQSDAEEHEGDGTVHHGNGEGTCGILPSNGGDNRRDDGAVDAEVEELLCTVGDTEDVVPLTGRDIEACDGPDHEETCHD